MGLESKILSAIEPVASRRASFTNGSLSLVDVSPDEVDQIIEIIRDVAPFTPLNLRQVGADEYVVDFDLLAS